MNGKDYFLTYQSGIATNKIKDMYITVVSWCMGGGVRLTLLVGGVKK